MEGKRKTMLFPPNEPLTPEQIEYLTVLPDEVLVICVHDDSTMWVMAIGIQPTREWVINPYPGEVAILSKEHYERLYSPNRAPSRGFVTVFPFTYEEASHG